MLGTGQNFDYIKANSHKHTSELLNLFISSGLIPNITSPTRTTHSSAKLIYIIYTNIYSVCKIEAGTLRTDMSDHYPVFIFSGYSVKRQPTSYLQFKYHDPNTHVRECIKNDLLT